MGKATGVGTIVFGVIMIILGIGAYFSGEESSTTSQGRMAIGIVIILGLGLILSGMNARDKANKKEMQAAQTTQSVQTVSEPLPPPPPPDVPASMKCSACGRDVQADFVACPFCGKALKAKCPSCGKQVQPEFVACPYCGKALR